MVDGLGPTSPPARLAAVGIGLPGLVTLDGVLRVGPNLPGVVDVDMVGGAGAPPRACRSPSTTTATARRGPRRARAPARGTATPSSSASAPGSPCGLVVGGRLVRGAHGFAGEPGHMTIVPGGAACACGRLGCWEAYGVRHRAGEPRPGGPRPRGACRASWPGPAGDPGAAG